VVFLREPFKSLILFLYKDSYHIDTF